MPVYFPPSISLSAQEVIEGWAIRKLIGGGGGVGGVGGGAGEVEKKYSRKAKLNEKKFLHAN